MTIWDSTGSRSFAEPIRAADPLLEPEHIPREFEVDHHVGHLQVDALLGAGVADQQRAGRIRKPTLDCFGILVTRLRREVPGDPVLASCSAHGIGGRDGRGRKALTTTTLPTDFAKARSTSSEPTRAPIVSATAANGRDHASLLGQPIRQRPIGSSVALEQGMRERTAPGHQVDERISGLRGVQVAHFDQRR